MSEEWCEEFARVAARFWADQLRREARPSAIRDAGYAQDGPEGLYRGAMMDMLVGMNADRLPKLTPEQVDRFEDALAKAERGGFPVGYLGTDYHPCREITDALSAAGIGTENADMRFTWKTHTMVCADGVSASSGYRKGPEWLVRTKRGAVMEAVNDRLHKGPWYPYGDNLEKFEALPPEEQARVRALYDDARHLMSELGRRLSAWPVGNFDTIVEAFYSAVVRDVQERHPGGAA